MKSVAVLLLIIIAAAVALSFFFKVPYIYTLLGFAAWSFGGHVITLDDDLPGGWSNPKGDIPFPWVELSVKALVLIALALVAYYIPNIRGYGGAH